jgi:hypothetical protein
MTQSIKTILEEIDEPYSGESSLKYARTANTTDNLRNAMNVIIKHPTAHAFRDKFSANPNLQEDDVRKLVLQHYLQGNVHDKSFTTLMNNPAYHRAYPNGHTIEIGSQPITTKFNMSSVKSQNLD